MEVISQKAVELGCNLFIPFITKRSLYKKLSDSKLARLRKIAHEASKQSGNFHQMKVSDPVEAEGLPDAELRLLLWEKEKSRSVKTVLDSNAPISSILLMVGPPGGFESDEVQKLKEIGFVTAGLGGLVQRTETAAISLMAIVNYHFGRI
jgi:16S rRNA (uracil1498-N3)-methyltransferase